MSTLRSRLAAIGVEIPKRPDTLDDLSFGQYQYLEAIECAVIALAAKVEELPRAHVLKTLATHAYVMHGSGPRESFDAVRLLAAALGFTAEERAAAFAECATPPAAAREEKP